MRLVQRGEDLLARRQRDHALQLFTYSVMIKRSYSDHIAVICRRFFDDVVVIGLAGDLVQVRDYDQLTIAGQLPELPSHFVSGLAADTGVDLIEYHQRSVMAVI